MLSIKWYYITWINPPCINLGDEFLNMINKGETPPSFPLLLFISSPSWHVYTCVWFNMPTVYTHTHTHVWVNKQNKQVPCGETDKGTQLRKQKQGKKSLDKYINCCSSIHWSFVWCIEGQQWVWLSKPSPQAAPRQRPGRPFVWGQS